MNFHSFNFVLSSWGIIKRGNDDPPRLPLKCYWICILNTLQNALLFLIVASLNIAKQYRLENLRPISVERRKCVILSLILKPSTLGGGADLCRNEPNLFCVFSVAGFGHVKQNNNMCVRVCLDLVNYSFFFNNTFLLNSVKFQSTKTTCSYK